MTHAHAARTAYSYTSRNTATPRDIEYKTLSQIASALTRANDNRETDYPTFIDAVSRNLSLWTVFGADTANANNKLSDELRGQIYFLFEYTHKYSRKILRGDTDISADPLIEINNIIMEGLRPTTDTEPTS